MIYVLILIAIILLFGAAFVRNAMMAIAGCVGLGVALAYWMPAFSSLRWDAILVAGIPIYVLFAWFGLERIFKKIRKS